MQEIWAKVPAWEALYEVSTFGRVRSVSRQVAGRQFAGKMMKLSDGVSGYAVVRLSDTANGRRKSAKVHRLVAAAFIDNPMSKPEVNHIDSDRQNNHVCNLEWVTASENRLHGYHYGAVTLPHRFGSQTNAAKLVESQVSEIQQLLSDGEAKRSIARKYGVSPKTIRRIANGENWTTAPAEGGV